ncbi:MAG: hypothetical protein IPH12_17855 [Saprospirales bacterium]|nr:hypothetical protein [Saprospirales bacterium]
MVSARLHELAAALLSALEQEQQRAPGRERRYGVDAFLRAQELFEKLPPGTPPEKLKFLLAPLFCQNEADQEAFYALAD